MGLARWNGALAALFDGDRKFLGTGFACSEGVLVTCAHNLVGCNAAVTARFDLDGTECEIVCRVVPGGWFPRTTDDPLQEPDTRRDIAVLAPENNQSALPQGPRINPAAPSRGELSLTGYYRPRTGKEPWAETIEATVQAGGAGPGWLRAKPTGGVANAPVEGMSGSPVFHRDFDGVVGMLFHGEPGGRGIWLMIPADSLAWAIFAIGNDRPSPGVKRYLEDVRENLADNQYASHYLHTPTQDTWPGEALRIRFGANFGRERMRIGLHFVQVHLELPASLHAEDMLGSGQALRTADGVDIRHRGTRKSPFWEINAPGTTLHGRNIAPEDPLMTLPGAEAGDKVTSRMVAFANKDFFDGEAVPQSGAANSALSKAKKSIIRRLAIKELGDPERNGEIVLSVTEHKVVEKAE